MTDHSALFHAQISWYQPTNCSSLLSWEFSDFMYLWILRCLLCALRYALWLLQCVDIFISSSFIGTPLSLMCTKVNVCMYLYIFGHSQWIRACMRSNKTLWYRCKRHGDCNCEFLQHTHRCLKTTKETASEENKQIN